MSVPAQRHATRHAGSSGVRYGPQMITPRPGDRIEQWLLSDDSPFAHQMNGGWVQEWDPDAEFEGDPEGRVAWDADPLGEFQRLFATKTTDSMLIGTGTQVTTVYEMVACLPSNDSDGHATWRLLMKIRSRTDPFPTGE
jgi:hypothetical protein